MYFNTFLSVNVAPRGHSILWVSSSSGHARQLAEVAGADLKASYPNIQWKAGKLLNRASKTDQAALLNEVNQDSTQPLYD